MADVGMELAGTAIAPVTVKPDPAVIRPPAVIAEDVANEVPKTDPVKEAPDKVAYEAIPVIAEVGIELEGIEIGP